MKITLSFQSRLYVLFFTSILVPLILICSILIGIYNRQMQKETATQYTNTLISLSQNLSNYMERMKQLSLSPHLYDDIMSFYRYVKNETFYNDTYLQISSITKYSAAVQRQLALTPKNLIGVCYMSINPNHNDCFIEYKYSHSQTITNYPYKDETWFSELFTNGGYMVFLPIHQVPYYTDKEQKVFSVVRMVRDVYTKENIGVIKVDSDIAILDDIFGELQISENSAMYLLDENENVIYCRGQLKNIPDFTTLENGQKMTLNNEHYNVYCQPLAEGSWTLVYLSSQIDAAQKTIRFTSIILMAALTVTVLSYMVFVMNSRKMGKQLENIISVMKQAENGDLEVQADTKYHTSDEFDLIALNLNDMIRNLKHYVDSEYLAVINQKNAEFLALQTQINPHFLYNVLNGFISLNRMGEKKLLEDSILHLTRMFRYTCNRQDISTLAEEFGFIEKYLSLQQLRFEERLRFSIEIDDKARNVLLPKMLIQPLVENAIIHGMEPVNRPVTITLAAHHIASDSLSSPNSYVLITVSNDGKELDTEKIHQSKRVGLTNVEERLAFFDEQSYFTIYQDSSNRTVCEIRLTFKEN